MGAQKLGSHFCKVTARLQKAGVVEDKKPVVQYHYDAVGRRRKLSKGAMLNIQRAFAAGTRTADLAEQWGVSVSTIRAVTYNTPRTADLEKRSGNA